MNQSCSLCGKDAITEFFGGCICRECEQDWFIFVDQASKNFKLRPSFLGLQAETALAFCASILKKIVIDRAVNPRPVLECECCHKTFISFGRIKKYCNSKCRNLAWNQRRRNVAYRESRNEIDRDRRSRQKAALYVIETVRRVVAHFEDRAEANAALRAALEIYDSTSTHDQIKMRSAL